MNLFECKRNCPQCNREIIHKNKRECIARFLCKRGIKNNSLCRHCAPLGHRHSSETKTKLSEYHKGQSFFEGLTHSYVTKKKLSELGIGRKHSSETKKIMAIEIKKAMHRPDVRKKHIDGLFASQWLNVKTDKGQLELLEKWNSLGFHFEPNFPVKGDDFLYYLDGYDKSNNVVMEYDNKYHQRFGQRKLDLIRQQKIIAAIKPKKFWRYDAVNKRFSQVV